jgi:hypothetical protein
MALLCLNLFSGCAEFRNESESDENFGSVVSADALSGAIKLHVQPTTKPEKYMVYFSWPKLEADKRIRIRNQRTLIVVPSSQTTFSHEVVHDQTMTYIIEVLDAASLVEQSIPKTVRTPRDFVVRGSQSQIVTDQQIHVQRLFLHADTPLSTNGHRVEITAEELISNNGVIETFPEGAKASSSQNGRPGGDLTIRIQKAIGTLKVIARGQDGGDGEKGSPYSSRAADGRPPEPGRLECEAICLRCDQSDAPLMGSRMPVATQRLSCLCSEIGTDATNGSPGAKGRTGGRAGHGGDSGNLKIEIQDGSSLDLQTISRPGQAGTPGKGGDGQPGGIAQGTKSRCSGNPGTNGPTGPQGDTGPKANDGKDSQICIFIASEGKNDCF